MKTLPTRTRLTVIFLSPGPWGGASHNGHPAPVFPAQPVKAENVTVVGKNRVWPPAGQITVEPCSLRRCFDV